MSAPLRKTTSRTQAKAIREALAVDRVLTTVQVARRGWTEGLPHAGVYAITQDQRVRAGQSSAVRRLTFITPSDRPVDPKDRLHLAVLAEMRERLGVSDEWSWHLVDDRRRLSQPDGELRHLNHVEGAYDWAVEADTGYPIERVRQKFVGYGSEYVGAVWGTTVLGRVSRTLEEVRALDDRGRLGRLQEVRIEWMDVSSAGDPYRLSSRTRKQLWAHYVTRRGREEDPVGRWTTRI